MSWRMVEKIIDIVDEFHKMFFKSWNSYPREWMGIKITKYPTDLFLYQMIIHRLRPDIILETGTFIGGGTLFFANMCDLVNHGEVVSVDKRNLRKPKHPRISYITGRSTDRKVLATIKKMVGKKTCMAVLDSDHSSMQVKRELSKIF